MDSNRANIPVSSIDVTIAILYILYGYHKQYKAIEAERHTVYFENEKEDYDYILIDLDDRVRYYGAPINMYKLYNDIASVSHEAFEGVYSKIISEVIENMASNNGRHGEFFTPLQISELIAYFVKRDNCKSVFDPFCGTASIVHLFKENLVEFFGQELSQETAIFARINLEAYRGKDSFISCTDSIHDWNESHFDAIVTCPPFGMQLSDWHISEIKYSNEFECENLEELLFTRSFDINHSGLVVSLEPFSFCYSPKYKRIRKYLVDWNYLDTVILLPEGLLYGTSVPCVLVVCKKERGVGERVKYINADSFYSGVFVRNRVLNTKDLISAIESKDSNIYVEVSRDQIAYYNFNYNPSLYNIKNEEIKKDQRIVSLGSIVSEADFERRAITPLNAKNIYPKDYLKTDCVDIWLEQNSPLLNESNLPVGSRVYHAGEKSFFLLYSVLRDSKPRFGLYTGQDSFMCQQGIRVMSINYKLVNPEYLIYLLVNNPVISQGNMLIDELLMMPVIIDSLDNQREIVEKIKQDYLKRSQEEQDADKKRLGVKQNISDLEHLLQTTQANIDSLIYDLEELYPEDKNYHSLVKGVKDNVEYMKRVIRFSNTTISSDMFNFKEHDIDEFIKDYCDAWKNFSGNYFNLELRSNLDDSNKVLFDKTYLKLMLDSILTNVERHGFNKHRSEENHVEISLSLEKFEEKAYVVIRVANNGEPFKEGFTINDYKTRGRYSAKTGRSGLGGYHVYQIAKGHNGFLYLDSNKIWNVIVEVLLPIDNVELDNLPVYEHECI